MISELFERGDETVDNSEKSSIRNSSDVEIIRFNDIEKATKKAGKKIKSSDKIYILTKGGRELVRVVRFKSVGGDSKGVFCTLSDNDKYSKLWKAYTCSTYGELSRILKLNKEYLSFRSYIKDKNGFKPVFRFDVDGELVVTSKNLTPEEIKLNNIMLRDVYRQLPKDSTKYRHYTNISAIEKEFGNITSGFDKNLTSGKYIIVSNKLVQQRSMVTINIKGTFIGYVVLSNSSKFYRDFMKNKYDLGMIFKVKDIKDDLNLSYDIPNIDWHITVDNGVLACYMYNKNVPPYSSDKVAEVYRKDFIEYPLDSHIACYDVNDMSRFNKKLICMFTLTKKTLRGKKVPFMNCYV